MGLLLDAAMAWKELCNICYIFDFARKGKLYRIHLSFSSEDFPHLAGMQYAEDVDFGLRRSEYYGERLMSVLLSKRMDDNKIEASRNWSRISGRLAAIVNLQNTLDSEFAIVAFSKKRVKGFCQIEAKFAIKNIVSGDTFFVFLDEDSGRYYCKSAFKQERIDYFAKKQSSEWKFNCIFYTSRIYQ